MAARSVCAVLFRHNCPTLVRNTSFSLSNVPFSVSVLSQRHYADSFATEIDESMFSEGGPSKPKKKLSKAMQAYLIRAKEHDEFIRKAKTEYEIGKRHLANMMGEDPDSFTQKDVNNAIRYLFPSGLFEPKARPRMLPPEEVFPPRKAAEFDESGRPFHSMFYTCKPNFHQTLYDIVETIKNLNAVEDRNTRSGIMPKEFEKMQSVGSSWISKETLEDKILETITDKDYEQFINTLERLLEHPYSASVTQKIMEYRICNVVQASQEIVKPMKFTKDGRPYVKVDGCQRKSAYGSVVLYGNGTGKITINRQDINYFERLQHREQVIFPLIFTGLTDKIDVVADISGGGPTGQSGAIRWGIAWGLRSFVDKDMVNKMRIAGLLTRDWRKRERKKPGQEGARRKFTWKKR